jgi:hypothetical protein
LVAVLSWGLEFPFCTARNPLFTTSHYNDKRRTLLFGSPAIL